MHILKGRNGGNVCVCGAVLIWGSTFVVSKAALAQLPPFTLAAARFLIATVVLMAVERLGTAAQSCQSVRRLPWGRLTLMGLTGVTLYFSLQNVGLTMTSASEASLVSASLPIITALLGSACLGETLSRRQLAGIGLATCGLAVLVLAGERSASQSPRIIGDALLFGAAVSWVIYTLLGRRLGQERRPLEITSWSTAIGTVLLLPLAAWELCRYGIGRIDVLGGAAVLYLGVVGSGATFLLWNSALVHLSSAEAANFTNGVPVVGVITGFVFLGERLRWLQLGGGIMVVVGVWLSTMAERHRLARLGRCGQRTLYNSTKN